MGYDVFGVVEVIGLDVMLFRSGDYVFYVGVFDCQGVNVEFQLVDECIMGIKLVVLSFEVVVLVFLIGLIVWEMLFDCLQLLVNGDVDQILLMFGGVGGVFCMVIQFVCILSWVNIIGIVFWQESVRVVCGFGVYYVLDYLCVFVLQVVSFVGFFFIIWIFLMYIMLFVWENMVEIIVL